MTGGYSAADAGRLVIIIAAEAKVPRSRAREGNFQLKLNTDSIRDALRHLTSRLRCKHKPLQFNGEEAPLRAELTALFAGRSRAAWLAALEGHDACCVPVNTLSEAFA